MDRLMKSLEEVFNSSNHDLVAENANTNGKSPTGMMSLAASESAKEYAKKLLDKDVLEAYEDGYLHVHDFDFYATKTLTCCQIPLGKLLKNGFKIGNCYIREPKSIDTAIQLTAIILQSNQNMQHGGQSIPNFDFDLAPYVSKSYERHYKEILYTLNIVNGQKGVNYEDVERLAWEKTEEETFQACEAFIHNANSMLCRNGAQVPFVSVNFGLDTSKEGRMVSKCLMRAQYHGLGDGSTPIFPILIWKLKKGISSQKGDPNYDLYLQALKTSAKRLFPTYVNVDAPFNLEHFDPKHPENAIATMG